MANSSIFAAFERFWQHVQTVFSAKVDKVDGMGLSSNDFTNDEKEKLTKFHEINYGTELPDNKEEGSIFLLEHEDTYKTYETTATIGGITANVNFVRYGNVVTMTLYTQLTYDSTAEQGYIIVAIPDGFYPVSQQATGSCTTSILWGRGSYLSNNVGSLSISADGILIFYDFLSQVTPSINWTLGATMTWLTNSD